MKPSQTKKRAMSAETFNMLMFAVILILAILVTVAIHAIVGFAQEDEEGNGQANTNQAGQQKTVTYHLNNPYTGVLSLCSPSSPWTEAQVDSVASTLIPLKSFAAYEKTPYLLAKDTLRAQAEAVMALGDLCQALLDTGITAIPVVTEAYLPYSEAKEGAGTSPFHTGYALTLSLRVTLTGAEETLPLTSQHPLVASATLWLCGHAHTFGFVAPDPHRLPPLCVLLFPCFPTDCRRDAYVAYLLSPCHPRGGNPDPAPYHRLLCDRRWGRRFCGDNPCLTRCIFPSSVIQFY